MICTLGLIIPLNANVINGNEQNFALTYFDQFMPDCKTSNNIFITPRLVAYLKQDSKAIQSQILFCAVPADVEQTPLLNYHEHPNNISNFSFTSFPGFAFRARDQP